MARSLPLVGVLESTPFYQQAWLFEPVFFLPGTEGTTAGAIITARSKPLSSWDERPRALVLAKKFFF
jgi:hypothetical protein